MANLMKRAADELKKKNDALKRIRENNKSEEQQMVGGAAALAGAVGAALIDKKFGEGGEQAKVFEFVPVNASLGGAITAGALFWKKMPMRLPVGMLGLGLACASAYRYTFDNVNFDAEPPT